MERKDIWTHEDGFLDNSLIHPEIKAAEETNHCGDGAWYRSGDRYEPTSAGLLHLWTYGRIPVMPM